jgi:peroxiredoxin Q/BCP
MLQKNDKAPQFSLIGDDGFRYELSAYRGSWVVVYFYPADDTPGCTTEACMIRDIYTQFEEKGIIVFGISSDSMESHQAFKLKYELPFTLLSDPEADAISDYDCQSMLGITKRMTYVIDPDGIIAKVYASVDPATHAGLLLNDLSTLTKI